MPRLSDIGKQFFDENGGPLAGGKLFFYETGTTTLATTYSDDALSTANANPVVLDADGRMPDVFYAGFLKIVLTDADDVVIETRDPVGFSASVTGIPDGGTTNQVLAKASDTDQDVEWQTVSGGGGAYWDFDNTLRTASFNAEAGKYYFVDVDTPASNQTITMPASPSVGDRIGFAVGKHKTILIGANGGAEAYPTDIGGAATSSAVKFGIQWDIGSGVAEQSKVGYGNGGSGGAYVMHVELYYLNSTQKWVIINRNETSIAGS